MSEINYDDSNLQKVFEALEPRRRRSAMKGALLSAAKMVKATATANLRRDINSNKELERGIRAKALTYPNKPMGFKVVIAGKVKTNRKTGKKKSYGFYKSSRFSREVPVLIFQEMGSYLTPDRQTRGGSRKVHSTGHLKTLAFLGQAKESHMSQATEMVHSKIYEYIKQTAQKYGGH